MTRMTARRLTASGATLAALARFAGPAWAQTATCDNAALEKEFAFEQKLMSAKPIGPADMPWLQSVSSATVDTTQYKKAPPYRVCFSHASVSNPWRVVGWKTMQAEADLHKSQTVSLSYADA